MRAAAAEAVTTRRLPAPSLRARLLAASLMLVAVGLVAASVATFSALRAFLYDRVDAQLVSANRSVERALFEPNGQMVRSALLQLNAVAPGVYVQIRNQRDQVLAEVFPGRPDAPRSSPAVPARLVPLVAQSDGTSVTRTLPSEQPDGHAFKVRISAAEQGWIVLVALSLEDTAATLRRLVLIEAMVSAIVLLLAAALGSWLVRLGLRPLGDIERTAAAITAGELSQRVADTDPETEVGRLGQALNTMLDGLDVALAERAASEAAARQSEQRMRRFVGDASHELRTPVAAVRAYAELYRRGADQRPEDLARLLSRIEQEAARMGLLVDDLLLLTRLDERRELRRDPVDLGAVATEAVDAARAVDPDRTVDLVVDGSVEVVGDHDRLRQVVDNLLANVRAHTPAGTPAVVTVGGDPQWGELTVADDGPGFASDDASRLFERFYRADPSRSRDSGGAGLGLAIVAAIAEAHDGTVSARAGDGGGAVVTVRLPRLTG